MTIIKIIPITTETVTEQKGRQKLFIHPVGHVAKRTTPQKDVMLEPMQQTGYFLEEQTGRTKLISATGGTKQYDWLCPGYSPTYLLEIINILHSGTVSDKSESARTKFWQPHVLSGSNL